MKKFLFLFVICFILLGFKKKHTEPYGYVWYETKSNGLYGAEDEEGNMLLPCRYQSITLDTFQTILNDFDRKIPTYDSFWMWYVKDENRNNLSVKTWQNNYGQKCKYSYVCQENGENVLVDDNFNVIYKGTFLTPECSLNQNSWVWNSGGDITDKVFFMFDYAYKDNVRVRGKELINKNGKVIIPSERKYDRIMPIQIYYK